MTTLVPAELGARLVAEGLIIPSGVPGVYGQGSAFAAVTDAVSAMLRQILSVDSERMRFASVMPRADLERIGYFRNFPHLLGTIHCFCGDERAHRAKLAAHDAGADWLGAQVPTDLALIPAACYSVYPALSLRGPVPADGYRVQVEANCFRHEPSTDPIRLQSFHMIEAVRVGRPAEVLAFRDDWLQRGLALFAALGLEGSIEAADDPFFGRAAIVMASAQRRQELKFEVKVVVSDSSKPTACMSANYHLDNFGHAVGLRFADGSDAHSACVGFGIERLALALFRAHGTRYQRWPATVLERLHLFP